MRTRYRAGGFPAKHLTWPNALGSPFSVFDCSGGLEHVTQEFVDGGGAQFGGDLAQALHDGIDRFIERGGAGGDADVAGVTEPRGIEFFGALNWQCAQATGEGFLGELARVVAVAAANDDDVVAMANQVVHGSLALLGGMADRVDESHLRAAMKTFDGLNQPQRVFDGLRGL